eukprot:TRINITY_DN33766_c0_g1_i1.p1 TRINITY_DN33766_c0_g1~~TRINITY_DN33766_c0_g1_i1.p1  ORF type:complete len:235 (+),score=12.99 TRINITY_DN33766_c0_g1_i1:57-761(+)
MGCQATKEGQVKSKQHEIPKQANDIRGKNRDLDVYRQPLPLKPKGAANMQKAEEVGHRMKDILAHFNDSWYMAVGRVEVGPGSGTRMDVYWGDGTFSKGVNASNTFDLSVGTKVEARWGSSWFPCTIRSLSPAIEVLWDDGTVSRNLADSHLRPPPPPSTEPLTPIQKGVFGRRPVLVPGTEVEVRNRKGDWHPAIVKEVGDSCHVEMTPTGGSKQVPLTHVRCPSDLFNQDLY